MALYHFSVSQIKRSAGQSALAAAAYRAGERLYSEYYDEISDYTRKGGVLHTEIPLPAHAPECFRDRATLWNAVEASERHPKAQLAYSFDIALQNELSLNENIELARAFVQKEFVDRGMIADLAIHSPNKTGGIPNPHMHVMTTMRPLNPDGSFAPKQRREYVLDASGNRIRGSDGRCRFMPSIPPIGILPKGSNRGAPHGATPSMPSLKKREFFHASTTALMRGKASNKFQPFMKAPTFASWSRKASARKKAS